MIEAGHLSVVIWTMQNIACQISISKRWSKQNSIVLVLFKMLMYVMYLIFENGQATMKYKKKKREQSKSKFGLMNQH